MGNWIPVTRPAPWNMRTQTFEEWDKLDDGATDRWRELLDKIVLRPGNLVRLADGTVQLVGHINAKGGSCEHCGFNDEIVSYCETGILVEHDLTPETWNPWK